MALSSSCQRVCHHPGWRLAAENLLTGGRDGGCSVPKELGSLEIPVSTFAAVGKLTETYNLEHKSGKGKITLSVVWREIVSPPSET